jgi:hypothetical protein
MLFKNKLKVQNENEKSCLEEQAITNLCKQTNTLNSPKHKTIETTKKQGKKKRTPPTPSSPVRRQVHTSSISYTTHNASSTL